MKNKLRKISLLISLLFSLAVFGLDRLGVLDGFENKSLDWRFTLRGEEQPRSPVVVAAMDELSLSEIGKWPWRRRVQAQLVDRLFELGAKAIVYDVIFYEPDNQYPADDRAFARAIRRSKRTVTAFSFDYSTQETIKSDKDGKAVREVKGDVYKGEPVAALAEASVSLGFVNSFPDADGNLRRAVLQYTYDDETFNALNLQAVSLATGKAVEELLAGLPLMDANPGGWGYPGKEVLVNYRGPMKVISADNSEKFLFPTYSCADIINGLVLEDWIKDKIVLIGATALATYDHYNIPFQSQFPGVYFHANIIDNLWADDFLIPVNPLVTIILIFIFALGIGVLIPRVPASLGAVVALVFTGAFWAAGYLLMTKKLYYLELVAPTVSLLGSYITVFFYRFLVEQKEKAGIKKAFGVYVNPHVVDAIAKNPEALKLGGEQREMTVMFSDVAGFTSISEKLSPQELVHLLNIYLTAMTDTIMKFDGTVDKYEGDAIMAFWGAPLVQPLHAKQACLAVLENRDRLKDLNVELSKKGLQQIFARCGLNTGPMNVGNMGSSQKFNYTVMGDAVNLASRLEGANKQYGTGLMVSETTYEAAKADVEVRELDLLRVKGKNVPIKVLELVCRKGELTDAQKKAFDIYTEGLELYRARQFKKALSKFEESGKILPKDGPSETYAGRCSDYIEKPPPKNWDGVFVMTTK